MSSIQYIPHNQIDFIKWDACIDQSGKGLIYAYSWFLNEMSPGWDALVLNDYDAVMPLTKRKKWGIEYLYQPAFCAELGIFSKSELSAVPVNTMLEQIPSKFRYIDICLNRYNHLSEQQMAVRLRRNMVLPLNRTYETIKLNYISNHRRNIKKARSLGLQWADDVSIETAVDLARLVMMRVTHVSSEDWKRFVSLFNKAQTLKSAICVGIKDPQGELLSTAVFFYAQGIWYYLLAGSSEQGKKMGAAHFLIDEFISRHAQTDTLLDFEGSDVESLYFFYKGFGAVEQNYPSVKLNRLPLLIRWIK